MDLDRVRDDLRTFAAERDWGQFHEPRNLLLALVGEVGELAELTQWRTDDELRDLARTPDGARDLGDELADVLSYLVQTADSLGLDLGAAWEAKMVTNAARYPAHLARGSNAKYTAYGTGTDTDDDGSTLDDDTQPDAGT
ncbi:nucleotide pyrophosphohydrolase [Georgenia sp. Z1491]|uniref:nucleotide pyrophosphohydrolase n=1 Tax=Georgenia sp. Z1491 TaxID=3416707 RepID=UPI003CEEEA65